VAYAAKTAKIDDYTRVAYPKRKNVLDELLGKAGDKAEEKIMAKNLGEMYSYVKYLRNLLHMKGVQARLPFEYVIN
jgi:protease-4